MDIERKDLGRKRRIRRVIYSMVGVVLVVAITAGLSRLKPAAARVESGTVWSTPRSAVQCFGRSAAWGRWSQRKSAGFPQSRKGRVERIYVLPGTAVKSETVLLELSNSQLQQETLDAELELKAAEAELKNLRVQLENQVLTQTAEAARLGSEYNEAKLRAETDEELTKLGVLSELNLKVSKEKARELANRQAIEKERLAKSKTGVEAQIAAEEAKSEQLRVLAQLKRMQLDSLRVLAGANDVLQELPLKVGQWVTAGTIRC